MRKAIRRGLVFLLIISLSAALFAQGASEALASTEEATSVRVAALKGPTAMGLVYLMDQAEAKTVGGNDYEFVISAAPTEVTPLIVKGEVDIAALPANLAGVLYNNTKGGVKVIAVNTLGVLYIVERGDSVNSIYDLEGKTVYASGKGSTPEYGLNYILSEAGLTNKVNVEWKSEHTECVAALLNDPNGVALLPQPFVTTAMMADPQIRVVIDLTKAWNELSPESAMITGVLVARSAFIEENKAALDRFLEYYAESTSYINENVAEGAALVGKYNIVPAKVAEIAIPECNIVCVTGEEMKRMLEGYIRVLFEANPASVGGTLPDEAFYYIGK